VKYNRQGGEVHISASLVMPDSVAPHWAEIGVAEPAHLRISIRDTGFGLSEAEVAKLFTPFERLRAAQSSIEGTGIGLVLSKSLVEATQGTIGVQSSSGGGSTFWVELPLVADPASGSREVTEAVQGGQLSAGSTLTQPRTASTLAPSTRTLLYIEDNFSNLRVVEMLLHDHPGIKLLSAMQGSVGLDLARQHHPDLILLDLHLPDLMGDEALRRLLADEATRDIPVVMLSADATPGQIERLLSAGAREYLTKPIDVKRFLQIIEEFLQP
jgi:CheY-like chemotaxis protein